MKNLELVKNFKCKSLFHSFQKFDVVADSELVFQFLAKIARFLATQSHVAHIVSGRAVILFGPGIAVVVFILAVFV